MPLTAVCGILPFPPISKGRSIRSLALGQPNPSGVFCTLPKNRREGFGCLGGIRIVGKSVCCSAGLRQAQPPRFGSMAQQIGGFGRLIHRSLQYGLADWWLRQAQPPRSGHRPLSGHCGSTGSPTCRSDLPEAFSSREGTLYDLAGHRGSTGSPICMSFLICLYPINKHSIILLHLIVFLCNALCVSELINSVLGVRFCLYSQILLECL